MPSIPEQGVVANRILVSEGVLDAFGHVSARGTDNPNIFLLARNLAPGEVTVDDIQTFDLEGHTNDLRKPYLELFIHAAIYAARPDVSAIVHSHAPVVAPFALTETPVKPVVHVDGFLGRGVPRFEILDAKDDAADLLVSDLQLGEALAVRLDTSAIVLMRGHGYVSVAESLPLAVAQGVYTQVNARVLLDSLALGEPTYLTDREAEETASSNATQVRHLWSVWSTMI